MKIYNVERLNYILKDKVIFDHDYCDLCCRFLINGTSNSFCKLFNVDIYTIDINNSFEFSRCNHCMDCFENNE